MKIIIPIEVEIDHPYESSKKWLGTCKILNIVHNWNSSFVYKDTPEQAIIGISNAIKNTITSEWLAMKIWEQFVKGNNDENIS
jgi:hypothetical protein